jgi:hypothetical protein
MRTINIARLFGGAIACLDCPPALALDKNPSVSVPVTRLEFGSVGVDPHTGGKGLRRCCG